MKEKIASFFIHLKWFLNERRISVVLWGKMYYNICKYQSRQKSRRKNRNGSDFKKAAGVLLCDGLNIIEEAE